MNRPVFMLLALLSSGILCAAEYFVSVKGSDSNPGTSEKAPLRTIKKGALKLVPGDTLTILPGEYLEEVHFEFSGDLKRPTRIRAKIPGTVHMRGDVPAPAFTPVKGRKNVYQCKVAKLPEYVLERDTMQKFKKAPSVSEVEVTPCSSYFDEKNKMVYLQTSDGKAPEYHCITFSVLRGDGIRIRSPQMKNIHVEGIMFSGYNSATPNGIYRATFGGVYMQNTLNCTVKNCIVYLCGSGVTFVRLVGSAVEDCIFFANSTEFNGSGGNLLCFGPGKTSVQRNIITFNSPMAGQRFYGGGFENCLIENCYSFDNKYGDIWIKYASDTSVVKGSYVSSLLRSRHIENCIFTSGDTYYHGKAKNSICRSREPRFNPDKEFAAPAHLDFRLRKESMFRKGGERGIKGYDAKVIFDDASKLVSGGTLYLTRSRKAPLVLRGLQEITVRGRGTLPSVLKGDLKIENCKNVRFENINVLGKVSFAGSTGVLVRRSAFASEVTLPAGTNFRHNLFLKGVKGADKGFSRGNIFCSSYSGKPGFAGWNAYVNGNIPAFEVASWKAPRPVFNAPAAGDFTLKNHYAFAGRSGDGFPTGQYRYDTVFDREGISFSKGVISPWSASFLIDSKSASNAQVTLQTADGKTIGTKNERGEGEYAVSFSGLAPSSACKVVCTVTPNGIKRLTNAPAGKAASLKFALDFTTPAKYVPRVWHVSPKGSNGNDGSSFSKALGEINAAIKRAAPGDKVLIAGGNYKELVRVTGTGSKGRFLTITGAPGAEVTIDGDGKLLMGVNISGREFVCIDNLRLINHEGAGGTPDSGGVVVRNSSDIQIKRIFYDNRSGSNQRSFIASNTSNMLIENSVAIKPFGGYEFWQCPNLEIRNCVFFRGQTINGRIGTTPTAPARVHHCIFVGQEIQKVKNPTFGAHDIGTFQEHDNGFVVRVPRKEKPIIGFNNFKGVRLQQNDGGMILNKEWKRQGRFYTRILTYDDFCKEQKRKPTALFGNPRMKGLPYYHTFNSLEEWHDQFILGKGGKKMKDLFRQARNKELQPGKKLRITDFIATDAEFLKRKIGLDPAAFKR